MAITRSVLDEEDLEKEFRMFLEVGVITKPWKNLQNIGIGYLRSGDYSRALEYVTKAINHVETFVDTGNSFFLERAVEVIPGNGRVSQDEEIQRYYGELFGDLGALYNTRGVIATEKGDFEIGVKDFEQAIFYSPQIANAHFNLGRSLMQLSVLDRAFEELELSHILEPEDREIERAMHECKRLLLTKGRVGSH